MVTRWPHHLQVHLVRSNCIGRQLFIVNLKQLSAWIIPQKAFHLFLTLRELFQNVDIKIYNFYKIRKERKFKIWYICLDFQKLEIDYSSNKSIPLLLYSAHGSGTWISKLMVRWLWKVELFLSFLFFSFFLLLGYFEAFIEEKMLLWFLCVKCIE